MGLLPIKILPLLLLIAMAPQKANGADTPLKDIYRTPQEYGEPYTISGFPPSQNVELTFQEVYWQVNSTSDACGMFTVKVPSFFNLKDATREKLLKVFSTTLRNTIWTQPIPATTPEPKCVNGVIQGTWYTGNYYGTPYQYTYWSDNKSTIKTWNSMNPANTKSTVNFYSSTQPYSRTITKKTDACGVLTFNLMYPNRLPAVGGEMNNSGRYLYYGSSSIPFLINGEDSRAPSYSLHSGSTTVRNDFRHICKNGVLYSPIMP